jgi:valyl-tRNA synthetase
MLKILAPVLPFATQKLYREITGKDVHFEEFPKPGKKKKIAFNAGELMELNSSIWKTKKENGKGLRDELEELILEQKFSGIKKDLQEMHNAKKIRIVENAKIRI